MSTREFFVLYVCILASMLASRCIPLFVLKGRSLSPRLEEAIGLIPSAAFAALVANDLFQPSAFAQGFANGMTPIAAALPVLVVAKKTNSLIWSALAGMVSYAALLGLQAML